MITYKEFINEVSDYTYKAQLERDYKNLIKAPKENNPDMYPLFKDIKDKTEMNYAIRKFASSVLWTAGRRRSFNIEAADFYDMEEDDRNRIVLKMLNDNIKTARSAGSKWAEKFISKLFLNKK